MVETRTGRKRRIAALVLLLVPLLGHPAGAIDALEFADADEAARYHRLVEELRCPKCLNTNLSGSDAPIAADLRALVYRQVRAGEDDAAIRAFLQARYGDFVLYDPPVRLDTIALWVLPALVLLVGIFVIGRMARRRGEGVRLLASDEGERLAALLSADAERRERP